MALFFKKLGAQINPFDHGQTWSTVARGTQPTPAPQRPTATFNQPSRQVSFGANNQFAGTPKTSSPVSAPKPSVAWNQPTQQVVLPKINNNVQVGVAQPIPQLGNKQITQSKPTNQMTAADYAKDPTGRFFDSVGLGIGRSLTGTMQSASGLVDAVSPGKGTSQFTKNLNKNAESQDARIKAQGLNNAAYHTAQVGTDIATFLIPGATGSKAAIKGAELSSKVPGAAKVTAKIAKTADAISKSGKAGKAAIATTKYLTKPTNVANIATDTALNTGFRAARGQDISPGTLAMDAGMSAGTAAGLGLAGKGIKAGANKVLDMAISDNVLKPRALPGDPAGLDIPVETQPKTTPKAKVKVANNTKIYDVPIEQQTPKARSFNDIADELANAQTAKQNEIMKYKGFEKARAVGRNISEKVFNPYAEGERFSMKLAKAMGVNPKDALARYDLAHQLDVVGNSSTASKQLAIDTGLADVIGRYAPGDEEKKFITYMAMKRDLDVRANKGKQILPYDTKTLEAAVAQYENFNQRALQDLAVVNNHFKVLLKNALDSGTITKADFNKAIKSENFYAPIARVLGSEDVLRPTINANVKAGLSRQSAIQTLTGSDSPIDTTWKAIYEATATVTRENARNRAFSVMYGAADNNFVNDMVRMGFSKEQSQSLLDLRDTIDNLQGFVKDAKKQVKLAAKGARVDSKKATATNNRLQSAAIEKIAKTMEGIDPEGAAAIRSLSRKDQAQLTEWLISGMTDGQINRGNKVNAKAQESYQNLMNLRAQAEGLIAETGAAKRSAREIQILKNEKTGRQVINGFVEGYPVWVETTPEMARMVQGLNPQELGTVLKTLSSIQHVWRTFWTGIFNPVFAAKSKIFYDKPMLYLNQTGSHNQLRPGVMAGAFGDNFKTQNDFFKELQRNGVAPVTGSRMMGDTKQSIELIAAHNDFQKRLAYYAKHPTAGLEAMDVFGGRLAHSSRMKAARAEYAKGIANKLSKEDALMNASRAYNNVLPNYARTTHLLRQIDAIIPYANAGVAGTRAMTTAMQKNPVGWSTKAGAWASALAAVGVYSMSDQTTHDFYQDMYDSNNQSVIQNNLVFALPGAHKDPATGQWTGIVKIPVPPEFRAPNALIQDKAFTSNGGDSNGYNPTVGALSTIGTGGIANIGRDGGVNMEMNPFINASAELSTNKQNTGTGNSFAYGDTQYLPRNDQINKDTSQLAISGAQAFNKLPIGDISPAALDSQLKSFGSGGKIIRSVGSGLAKNENTTPDQLPGTDIKKSITGVISADGTKGMTDTKWHFKNQDAVKATLQTKDLRDSFDKLNSKNDTPGDSQAKSQLLYESLQTDGKLWDAQKKQNELDAKKGGLSNPLFSLTPEQARAVTLYRGNARMNAAKQSYAKDGSSLFQSLGLDEKWYQDFKTAEGAYYDKIKEKTKNDPNAASQATAAKTYSGASAVTSPVMQSKLDQYYAYPAKSAERKAYLKANPDIVAYWDQQNGLANEERLAMGLDLLGADQYSKYGSGGNTPTLSKKGFNPYNYAVSTSSGGGKPKTIKAKAAAKVGIAAKSTASAKPKVTIKKSLV